MAGYVDKDKFVEIITEVLDLVQRNLEATNNTIILLNDRIDAMEARDKTRPLTPKIEPQLLTPKTVNDLAANLGKDI